MSLRDATPADLAVIAELIRSLADYEHLADEVVWTDEQLGESLFGPVAVPRVVLAEVDDPPGTMAGLAIWYPTYSSFLAEPGIWLEDLFVRPEYRGRGLGRDLLEHLFERAGGGRVEWAVLDWNAPSIEFYDSLGAQPVPGWTRYRWIGGSRTRRRAASVTSGEVVGELEDEHEQQDDQQDAAEAQAAAPVTAAAVAEPPEEGEQDEDDQDDRE